MCGIAAILNAAEADPAASELYESLNILQHRGQDAAGIVTCKKGKLFQCKGNGLVRDIFSEKRMLGLSGNMGVAHVRYPTAGSSSVNEAQPFYVNSPYGIALAHNGNLVNTNELKDFLDSHAHRHINTNSDSEVLLNIFASELQAIDKFRIDHTDIFAATSQLMKKCSGGYAVVLMITGYGIVAFRDAHAIRPIVYGKRDNGRGGIDRIAASESVVLDALGFTTEASVAPGEVIIFTNSGQVHRQVCVEQVSYSPCIFEYVYFARPDSIIDGISVYKARLAMGEYLAKKIKRDYPAIADQVDVVIPVPDTSRVAALQLSVELGKTYREGFIKNRYIGRTFIMPGQQMRVKSVRRKLNPMPMEFADKNVLLVDDSIVRGTTAREIIMMVRDCGAKKVFMASCAPAIRFPNVYGIDMPSPDELVAYNKDDAGVAQAIGADGVIYQDLPDLIQSCSKFNPAITTYDTSVFDGNYVTKDVSKAYLDDLAQKRADSSKSSSSSAALEVTEMLGLHNDTASAVASST
ncbi:amidophosphoribosyltransferase [Capsaspora owczarzaki ATCC 30864]|uniref:Amidophosphoribosyltransferase n=1 Tax=Capsaspora owczarzaki (strain ATCC 30864) TaxID=595528 RepID=A0A0D2WLA6_CAPO3|nr:amidophosphoribosyltransferase [Capsaspora owczarzaki ATCC 30864]KJE91320.1 amidophosphoribosyltransferase [Capsaspora owczarzaki ATCC 30864]|eukprot:XP_004349222.2 amidophosphoribosyltransferase [Capsaspora owczarzaki ATCC 30864]